jgi:hypothetical protein
MLIERMKIEDLLLHIQRRDLIFRIIPEERILDRG